MALFGSAFYRFPESVSYTCCVCILSFVGCQDDPYWRDSKYGGDGNARCIDLTLDWCNNHGEYSKEAQRACPASCGLCKGIFVTFSKLRSILLFFLSQLSSNFILLIYHTYSFSGAQSALHRLK